jgi:hypothetical protein
MIEFHFGLAQIEFMGGITSGRIIFADDDARPQARPARVPSENRSGPHTRPPIGEPVSSQA